MSKHSVCNTETPVVAEYSDDTKTEAARPNQLTLEELDHVLRDVFATANLTLLEHRAHLVVFQRLDDDADPWIEAGYEAWQKEAWRKAKESASNKLNGAVSLRWKTEIADQLGSPNSEAVRASFVNVHEERFALLVLSNANLSSDQLKCAELFLSGGSIGDCEVAIKNALIDAGLLGFFRSWWNDRNIQLRKAAQKLLVEVNRR